MAQAHEGDSVEQQVTDKLQSAFLFAFGDDPTPDTPSVADPMKVQVYRETLIQEIGECIKLLAREVDKLRAER